MHEQNKKGLIFRIEKYMISDGLGIRTNIFLKGCPLRCKWCFNPEGINGKPEILIFRKKCIHCEECIAACPKNAVQIKDGQPIINRNTCDACGKCVEACPTGALEICGKLMTVSEVIEEVRKDEIFYRKSGGGVTLTGGELCAQSRFATNLLMQCKGEFHTAIETSGFTPWQTLKKLLEYSDQVFFDIKHMDSKKHHELTNVKNDLILANLKKASQFHHNITVRIPLVPGHNDDFDNIIQAAIFIRSLKNISKIEILPYVDFGKSKYEMLDRRYEIHHVKSPSSAYMSEVKNLIRTHGIDCYIVD
jgi:pyruvate formate lyase activating enzyme